MNQILKDLDDFQFDSCINWTIKNQEKLQENNSKLEFQLHKVKYLDFLIIQNNQTKAMNYAKIFFPRFNQIHKNGF